MPALKTPHDFLSVYQRMIQMRAFEMTVANYCASGAIHGEMHLAVGQEAVAAVMERHLCSGDAVVSTHRAHLHALAQGVDPVAMLAELLERDGLNHGKGGHMHLFDPTSRFMCTGIVGASAPIALGYALAQRNQSKGAVTVAVAGDAAVNQGAVFEAMNLAAVASLPVIFLVEDNGYGISVPRKTSTAGEIQDRGQGFGIPALTCDGRDVQELDDAFEYVFDQTREQQRPSLLIAQVYRFRGHYEGDTDHYRPAVEKERAMNQLNDPISRLRTQLLGASLATADELDAVEASSKSIVKRWTQDASNVAPPSSECARTGVFTDA